MIESTLGSHIRPNQWSFKHSASSKSERKHNGTVYKFKIKNIYEHMKGLDSS